MGGWKESQKGLLVVLSGPSGAGKGTVCRELLKRHPEYALSVSVTTRAPRAGEKEAISYFFRSHEEFKRMIAQDAFLEYADVYGHCYGTPRTFVMEKLNQCKNVLLEIDIQGALQVKEKFGQCVCIFILPPSMEELHARIAGRRSETEQSLLRRFTTAYQELNYVNRYNYVVINDSVACAVACIEAIICAEQCSVERNEGIDKMLLGGDSLL